MIGKDVYLRLDLVCTTSQVHNLFQLYVVCNMNIFWIGLVFWNFYILYTFSETYVHPLASILQRQIRLHAFVFGKYNILMFRIWILLAYTLCIVFGMHCGPTSSIPQSQTRFRVFLLGIAYTSIL